MTTLDVVFQGAAALLAVAIGWLARGIAESIKQRKRNRAWGRARRFLPSRTSKL